MKERNIHRVNIGFNDGETIYYHAVDERLEGYGLKAFPQAHGRPCQTGIEEQM